MNKRIGAVVTVLLVACQASPPPTTATELAEALRDRGVAYTSTQSLPKPSGGRLRFDEAMALVADDLWVEIIRIDDERIYGIAKDASAILTIAEVVAGREFPGKPSIYAREPFLVIVRQEPVEGEVLKALDAVMPTES